MKAGMQDAARMPEYSLVFHLVGRLQHEVEKEMLHRQQE
jgi:hypothetical protein